MQAVALRTDVGFVRTRVSEAGEESTLRASDSSILQFLNTRDHQSVQIHADRNPIF